MLIALGSKSRIKYLGVRLACERLGIDAKIIMVDADSGVNKQPMGPNETRNGACNRVEAALHLFPDAVAIGIENGIWRNGDSFEDRAIVGLQTEGSGGIILSTSAGQPLPINEVREAQRRGLENVTVGEIIHELHSDAAADDPHSYLTGGKFSRLQQLTDAVVKVLKDAREYIPDFSGIASRPIDTVRVKLHGVGMPMPVREVAPGVRIALFDMLGNWKFVEQSGSALAEKMPDGIDTLAMPDGKAREMLHVMGRGLNIPTVIARKQVKPYMTDVLSVDVTSITTGRSQTLHLDGAAAAKLRGKRVAIVDDVVSTGASLKAMEQLLEQCGAIHTATLAIFTEGEPRDDVISLAHLPLF